MDEHFSDYKHTVTPRKDNYLKRQKRIQTQNNFKLTPLSIKLAQGLKPKHRKRFSDTK